MLLSSLLWWELGTSVPGPGPGEWLSFWRVTSKQFWTKTLIRLICAFVVRIWHKQVFWCCGSFYKTAFLFEYSYAWTDQIIATSFCSDILWEIMGMHWLFRTTLFSAINGDMSRQVTKPTKWQVHPAKTQIRLGICPVWSESLLGAQWGAKDPSFIQADSKDWSDWADAQADLSLRWAHMPFCWFCHEAAHII